MKSNVRKLFTIPVLLVAALFLVDPTVAQDVEKKTKKVITLSGDDETVTIEIEDGKTFVNGVEVPEGEDVSDYLPEGFDTRIIDGDDRYFFASPGNNQFKIRTKKDGSGARFSGDEILKEYKLRTEGLARDLDVVRDMEFDFPGPEFYVRDLAGGFFTAVTPEVRKKEKAARELASKLRSADDSDRRALEAELDQLLDEIFEEKLELRQERLDRQQEEVQELADELNQRREKKREIIERRKAELTGTGDYLEW